MKTPRLTDFDPDAKTPKLGSPLDDMPSIQNPTKNVSTEAKTSPIPADKLKSDATKIEATTGVENEEKNETTNVRTNERSIQRRKIRHTFDIYEDQLLSLKEISLEREKTFGNKTLLGDLVQEALDTIITKERNKE